MRATNALLHVLRDRTDRFRTVTPDLFECPRSADLLLAGKALASADTPSGSFELWSACSVEFDHSRAAQDVVGRMLRQAAVGIVDFVLERTALLTELTAEWIMQHPFALPVFVNASGPRSKKRFKDELSIGGASDRSIGRKDAERILAAVDPLSLASRVEILGGISTLIEGITRNLTGKIVNEGMALRALDDLALSYVRDDGGTKQVRGVFMDSRADFALPCNAAPEAIVDVRKSSSRHSSLYCGELSNGTADKITRYPNALAVFLYDGRWTAPAMDRLRLAYDFVFHVNESVKAADIIRRHLSGEDMRKSQRVYFTHVEPGEHRKLMEAARDVEANSEGCVLTPGMKEAMARMFALASKPMPAF